MNRKSIILLFPVIVIGLIVSCGEVTKIENEEQLIETAKTDFLSPDRASTMDLGFQYMEMDPNMLMSGMPQFEEIEVTSAKIFDYHKLPNDDKYWAVELGFKATHTKTGEVISGIAILHYASFIHDGSQRESELLYMYTGVAEEEIAEIRRTSESVFKMVRQFQNVSKIMNVFK